MAFRTIEVELKANTAGFTAQLGAAAASTKRFGQEVGTLAASSNEAVRAAGKVGVVVGGVVVAGFGLAVREAARFESGMRNVNSIMKQSESEFRATSAAVLDISRRVPQAATTLAEGLYDIASSGFEGAAGLQVLEASAIAATAGMSDTATAARAITGIINAYGQSAEDAADISDILFQTVNLGVVTFEELAQGVGDWVGTAAALKVPVDEASAALATMTLSGIGAAEASTALNRVMQSFIKPTDAMSTAINELGYESGVAMVEMLGLDGAVMAIEEHTNGSVEATANLYGEVRAIKGALALTAADGESYARVLGDISDESARAGAAQEAYEEQSKALSVQMDLAKSSISAAAIEIGTNFLPILTSAAQVVASVADAFSSMPGPVRGVVTVFTGIAGAVALLGGAAIVAAPKIAAFKLALLDIATRPGGSAGATRMITGMSGAVGMLGRSLPVVGLALTAGAALMTAHGRATAEAQGAVEEYTEALNEQGEAIGALTRLTTERRLGQGGLGEDLADAGANLEVLSEALERQPYLVRQFAESTDLAMGDVKEALEDAGLAGTAFGDEILRIFDSGELGPKSTNELRQQLALLAGSYLTAKDATAENADVTQREAAAAFQLAAAEAKELGINLDATSELASKTGEEMAELRGSLDPVIFGMLEMGDVTVDQAERMQKAMENYVAGVGEAFSGFASPMKVHSDMLQSQEDAHREHAENLAAIENEGIDKRGAAIRGAAADTAEAITREAQDQIAAANLTGQAADQVRRSAQDRADAVRAAADAEADALNDGKRSWEDFAQHQMVSLEDYTNGLALRTLQTASFAEGIQEAITRGYDPQVIADLLIAGPEEAAPMLETLLSDHSGTMVELVNGGAEALREISMQASEMARLMHLAVTSSTDQMNRDLSTAMEIAQATMASGGQMTAEALATQLQIGADEVARIAEAYGISLAAAVNPVLEGVGRAPLPTGGFRTQEGSVAMATGGVVPGSGDGDTVPAMLTPGEFVIRKGAVKALGVDHLRRLNEADRRHAFAAGGLVPPPDVSGYGTVIGHTGAAVMQHAYQAVRGYGSGGLVDRGAVMAGGRTGTVVVDLDYNRLGSSVAQAIGERQQIIQITAPTAPMDERDLARELRSAEYLAGGVD